MSAPVTSLWHDGELHVRDDCDVHPVEIAVADSWLVDEGSVLAIDLHRDRFLASVPVEHADLDAPAFWDEVIASLPRTGRWFPRIEARTVVRADGARIPQLIFRHRTAPERGRAIWLVTHDGADPRTSPRIKGPDLEAMVRLRTEAQARGAGEAVILEADGAIAEGSTTCLVWWRGDALALPEDDIARIDSVTVRSILALAAALGVEVLRERTAPTDLDGLEVWAVNALHGIRVVTRWIDGPATAELPGRAETWRRRLSALGKPLPVT